MTKSLLLLPGDGIGPEVCTAVRLVIDHLVADHGLSLEVDEHPFGGTSYDLTGLPLSREARAAALKSNAVLMGAVGGPKWESVERGKRPEAGLLELRTALGAFANLRPAFCFDALAEASTLRREVIAGLDLVIVRELTGGVYFGTPRGIVDEPDGSQRGFDTQVYTTSEIERVARVAFALARGRGGRVTSVEKSNVMESGLLWRRVVTQLHAAEFADVSLDHMYADNCAMQLIRNPRQFDVILTDNLFGDILSDAAAMMTGSLGMLPSAALSAPGQPGLYEPVHGSAPDIAGQNIANPVAAILSLEMALRWSLAEPSMADRLRRAVSEALEAGARTRDLGGDLSTLEMTAAIVAKLTGR